MCFVAPAAAHGGSEQLQLHHGALQHHLGSKSAASGTSAGAMMAKVEHLCSLQQQCEAAGDAVQDVTLLICSSLDAITVRALPRELLSVVGLALRARLQAVLCHWRAQEHVQNNGMQQEQQVEDAHTLAALLECMARAADAARAAISTGHSPHSQDQQLGQLTMSAFSYIRHATAWLQQALAAKEGRAACVSPCGASSCALLTTSVMHAARTSLFSTRCVAQFAEQLAAHLFALRSQPTRAFCALASNSRSSARHGCHHHRVASGWRKRWAARRSRRTARACAHASPRCRRQCAPC